jgi:hypothetical protein
MRILLVYPEFPDTFWSFKHALRFIQKKAASPADRGHIAAIRERALEYSSGPGLKVTIDTPETLPSLPAFVVRASGRIYPTYPFGVDQIYRQNDTLS